MDDANHARLEKYLTDLSKKLLNEEELNSSIDELKQIYTGDFRHFYSRVFATITTIQDSPQYDLQNLVENLKVIFDKAQATRSSDEKLEFYNHVKKLYDHVNLDVSRIKYTKKLIGDSDQEYKSVKDSIQNLHNRSEKMQRDYVTILGIFAAIIVAFVSGMVFSTSVLNNIDKVSIYRLVGVMLLIAMFLFNMVNLLIGFVKQINGAEVGLISSLSDIFQEPYTSIKIINGVLTIALVADVIVYCYNR